MQVVQEVSRVATQKSIILRCEMSAAMVLCESRKEMKIADVHDFQLSEWIAQKIEPVLPPEPKGDANYLSPERCYRWNIGGALRWEWQAQDFVNDPAMTVMLFDKMHATVVHISEGYNVLYHADNMPHWTGSRPHLGRTLAEAFALANGWTE